MADPTPIPPAPPPPAPQPAPAPKKPINPFLKAGILIGIGIGIPIGIAALGGGEWAVWKWWSKPGPNPVNAPITISIDPSTPPHAGRRVLIHADTAGGLVKWFVISAPTTSDNYDFWPEVNNTHDQNLVGPAGNYRLQAITIVSNAPEEAEITVPVDVAPTPPGPGPGPGPGPQPPGPTPPIPAGQLRVLMTYDPDATVTSGQLSVLKSAATQKLVPAGNWKVFTTKQTFGDELPVWKDVYAKRKNPIGLVIFNGADGSIAYEGELPKSMADAQALIKKYGG